MALSYIKIFLDCLDAIEPLDDGERGRLFTALLQYARTGEIPVLQGNERFIFPVLRRQHDRDAVAYERVCKANRSNGSKGGRARAQATASESSQDKDKDEDKDKEKEKDKDFSSYGVGRSARKNGSSGNRSRAVRQDCPENLRRDIEQMRVFFQSLQQVDRERAGDSASCKLYSRHT